MSVPNPQQIIEAAAGLAARGDYRAAEAALEKLGSHQDSSEARLLGARIAAQQRRFGRAIELCQQVLDIEPDNAGAKEAMELARRMKDRPSGRFFLRAKLYYAALLLTITVLLLTVIGLVWKVYAGRRAAPIAPLLEEHQKQLTLAQGAIQALTDRQEETFRSLSEQIAKTQQLQATLSRRSTVSGSDLSERVDALAESARQLEQRVQDSSDVFSARIETLSSSAKQLQQHVQSDNAQFAEDVTALGGATKQLEALVRKELGLFAERISSLTASAAKVEQQLRAETGQLSEKIDKLTQAAQDLNSNTLDSHRTLVTSIEKLGDSSSQLRGMLTSELRELRDQQQAARQIVAAQIEQLAQRQEDEIAAVHRDIAEVFALSEQMDQVTQAYQKLSRKFWWPSARERKAALARLEQLQQAVDTLVAVRLRQH